MEIVNRIRVNFKRRKHTREAVATGFGGGTGVASFSGRFRFRLLVAAGFFAGMLGGLDSPGPHEAFGGWGSIATPPMPGGTASGKKSLNSAKRSGASLNNIWTCTYT